MHWKKGPAWWLKYSHYVFFVLLLINYLILPIINIAVSLFYILYPDLNLKEQSIESYVIFIFIVCISRVIEFFVQIRRTVLLDARIYLQTKAEIES